MALKVPYQLKQINATEAPQLNENFARVYSTRLESRQAYAPSASANIAHVYQAMCLGEAGFSANGSPAITKTFPLPESYQNILYASAHARHSAVTAHVVDVTGTAVTIEARTISGTANFSAVTTASLTVYWQVIGD